LEARTEQALQLCKSWLPADLKRPLQQELTRAAALTDQQAAEHAGQTELPSAGSCNSTMANNSQLACSGCGQPAWQLRKCSRCKAVSYCSRECQLKHWKEGGHKKACPQLAAAGSGGASGSQRDVQYAAGPGTRLG
jgi:hypothetical protein